MKKVLTAIVVGLTLLCVTGLAQASLTTIGTATYGGLDYNLIWDKDNNGNSIVWLDYTNDAINWYSQKAWAAGLDSSITYNIDPGCFTVAWDDAAWRLPSTGSSNAGYDQTTSEMGDLFYNDLGLSGSSTTTTTAEQLNATNFDNLIAGQYWSGTEYSSNSGWVFIMKNGYQGGDPKDNSHCGLAVRGGQVSAVPVPGAIWLLGSGLLGLLGIRRRRKGMRV